MNLDEEIRPIVDYALLADAVQVVQGKLYVLGGGWDTLFVPGFPARFPSLGVGLRIRVPWSWADQVVVIGVDLQEEDGARVLPSPPLTQGLKVTRPDGLPEGSDLGVARSFTFNNITFPKAGGYSFVISIDEQIASRLRFSVRPRPS